MSRRAPLPLLPVLVLVLALVPPPAAASPALGRTGEVMGCGEGCTAASLVSPAPRHSRRHRETHKRVGGSSALLCSDGTLVAEF